MVIAEQTIFRERVEVRDKYWKWPHVVNCFRPILEKIPRAAEK
jgi:hypothetical protein